MDYRIAVLPGDGVGPEVVAEGIKVLHVIEARYDVRFNLRHGLVGGAAIDATGDPLPEGRPVTQTWSGDAAPGDRARAARRRRRRRAPRRIRPRLWLPAPR